MLGDIADQAGAIMDAVDAAMDAVEQIQALASLADLGNLANPVKPIVDRVGDPSSVGSAVADLGGTIQDLIGG